MTANRLHRRFGQDEAEIHVVDRDDRHVYQPGLLFVPFGLAHLENRAAAAAPVPQRRRLPSERGRSSLDKHDEVLLDDGTVLPYDVLVVATGVRLQPGETEG